MKSKKIYLINIFIVTSIFIIVFLGNRVAPFGKYDLGISDGLFQFKPMLYDFIMKIKLGALGTYSFNNGLGNPTLFNILYYLNSPINIIGIIFNDPDKMFFMVILVKLIISSITMTFYAVKKTDKVHIIIISTISYVFCEWYIIHYSHIIWTDIFMIFPLYHYYLEKIIKENKCMGFILTLTYIIYTNFYLAFSVCLYSLIFYIIYGLLYLKKDKNNRIKTFKTMFFSIIIVLLLSFAILYALLISFKKMNNQFDIGKINNYQIHIITFIRSLLYGQGSFALTSEKYTIPNISINLYLLSIIILYLISNKTNKRDKKYVLISILICISIMYIPYLDFAFNLFHNVNGFAFRYSFIICFLAISLFIESSNYDYSKEKILYLFSYFLLVIIIAISIFDLTKEIYKNTLILLYINGIFLVCYLILDIFMDKECIKRILLVFLISLESLSIYSVYMKEMSSESILEDNSHYVLNKEHYRVNHSNYNMLNNDCQTNDFNLLYDIKSTTLSTSMSYISVLDLMNDLGNFTFKHVSYAIAKDNKVSRMLFNEKKDRINKYYLEKIYAVSNNIKDTHFINNNYCYNQNELLYKMSGVKNTVKNINKCLDISKRDCDGPEPQYYNYNEDQLRKSYNYLKKNQIKYTYYSDSRLEGYINVDDDQLIFTSIPYDESWDIYIDGKKVKPIKLLNSLMGIEVNSGKHKLKMLYKYHLIIPIMVSFVTFLLLLWYYIYNAKHVDKEK